VPLPIILNVYRCSFNWTGVESDRPNVSVQHFRTTQSAADLATDINSAATPGMFSTEANVSATSVDIIRLDGVSASQSFPLTNWDAAGGGTEQLPGFNILVLGSTGLRGPGRRGRLFLPGVGENVVTEGMLDNANAVAMTTAWNDYRVALGVLGVEYGVASYVDSVFTTYTSMLVPRKLGIIRRRRNTI
jgi:hypothetical protein